ncbi:MAG: hypothetical protein AMXMBFR33_57790 [Candidatus Xenobia bacterium]
MAVTEQLLALLERPRTTAELSGELKTDEQAVEGLLSLLGARGYVGKAYDRSPTCGTGCGSCSLQRLCPAKGEEAPFLPVWRLTGRGRDALLKARGTSTEVPCPRVQGR